MHLAPPRLLVLPGFHQSMRHGNALTSTDWAQYKEFLIPEAEATTAHQSCESSWPICLAVRETIWHRVWPPPLLYRLSTSDLRHLSGLLVTLHHFFRLSNPLLHLLLQKPLNHRLIVKVSNGPFTLLPPTGTWYG